jgi:hypothetical protein
MKKQKIDKTSIEYLVSELFHKDIITGFQFTAGRTPLSIKNKQPLELSVSINKSKSVVVSDWDAEKAVECKIFNELFPNKDKGTASIMQVDITLEQVKIMQTAFRKLGYQVDGEFFAGEWYWFRIKCKSEEIPHHLERLKSINWIELLNI